MNPTPEEQRAVEAARRWSLKFTDSDADAYDCFYEVFSGEGDAAGFACGYLTGDRDGFKRGVEAALHEAMMADSIEEARHEIRALLAQEEKP